MSIAGIRGQKDAENRVCGWRRQGSLLGQLQLAYGAPLKLPASKKTRALLGYLIATGQPHRHERL